MSGHYTNHSKSLTASSSARIWNQNTSTNEGTDSHDVSLSGPTFNEPMFYTQATITCSPHLSVQIAHNKNSANWHTPSTLLSNSIESLSKSTTPLLSLQMLVDNRQSQIKNLSEKKDFFETILNVNSSNMYQKTTPENQTYYNSRNINKDHENDNITLGNLSSNECHTLDTSLSITSIINHKNENNSNRDKDVFQKNIPINFDINKLEMNYGNHDKFIDNVNFSSSLLNFSPEVTIEKIDIEKKYIEAIKDVDISKAIMHTKNLIPVTTSISRSDRNVKDDCQETYSDLKKKINELNFKASKNFFKKGKKGVDYLLEKLESSSKKFFNSDNLGSTSVINVDEKDSNSIKSMSPEYCKSRSPNNRDDDVVSPCFSNDDSNDTKQRRKRKLGKPVRLSKESKLEHEDVENEIRSLRKKSEIVNPANKTILFQNSLLSTYIQNKNINKTEFDIKKNNTKICSVENQKIDNELKLNNFHLRKIDVFKNDYIKKEEINSSNDLNNYVQSVKKNYKINMNQYLIQTLKDTKCTRTRRSSESSMNLYNINKKKRRKSCDDIRDLIQESFPITTVTNNIIAFNEVESQLEEMFAGIIETDKDLLKKTMLDSEKSVTLLSDVEQKENLNSEKLITEKISENMCSEIKSKNNYKNIKKKTKSTIRPHKKKVNSCKQLNGIPINNLGKEKKRCADKRSLKKSCALKKNRNIKLETLREIICDPSVNSNPAKYKGPVIQIKGSKINPLYIEIINTPREDDEERYKEKRKTMGNGNLGRSKKLYYQSNIDCRGKACNTELFNSTLSIRYDAHTADITWICVFCKRGPHFIIPGDSARPHPNVSGPHIIPGAYTVPAGVLSDLFGPYIIGKDYIEDTVMSPDENEITKEQKQGNKNKRSLRYSGLADQFIAKVSKKKKKCLYNSNNIYMGMIMLGCDEQRWEVWLHEECIIWAAGVYITGGRISGLQDAVWDASKSICNSCGLSGANIGCIKRGCKLVTHYCCALTSGWDLDINQYIPKCNIHRIS